MVTYGECVGRDLRVYVELLLPTVDRRTLQIDVELRSDTAPRGFCQRAITDGCRFLPRHERRNSRAKVLERVRGQEPVVELSGFIDSELRSSGRRIHGAPYAVLFRSRRESPLTDPLTLLTSGVAQRPVLLDRRAASMTYSVRIPSVGVGRLG